MKNIWDKVSDLFIFLQEFGMPRHEEKFITNLFYNLDPHNPNEEINSRQLTWLNKLYIKYIEHE